MVKEKALFSSDELQIANMIKEGPTTSGLPEKGGPDRMGQFIGYRMVRHYMKEKEMITNIILHIDRFYHIKQLMVKYLSIMSLLNKY